MRGGGVLVIGRRREESVVRWRSISGGGGGRGSPTVSAVYGREASRADTEEVVESGLRHCVKGAKSE